MNLIIFKKWLLLLSVIAGLTHSRHPLHSQNRLRATSSTDSSSQLTESDCINAIQQIALNLTQLKNLLYIFIYSKQLNEYGDQETCEMTAGGQYVLINIQGDTSNKYVRVLGGQGKFFEFGSVIGICVPTKCSETYVTEVLTPIYEHFATNAGYKNVNVTFTFSTNIQTERLLVTNLNPLMWIPVLCLVISIMLGMFGLVVEYTQIGNRKDIAIIDTIKVTDYNNWNKKLLLHKEIWALFFLAFSPSRNTFFILGRKRKKREYKKASKKAQKSISNLNLIDGIRGMCVIAICFAHAFELSQYAIINNLEEMPEYTKGFFFNICVAAAYALIEIFTFTTGITQAISFLQKTNNNPRFCDIITYVLARFIKVIPMYYLTLLFQVYIFRLLGQGPIWHFFDKLLAPCDDHLWSNLLFINNLYPNFGAKNDMCMPWTWIIAIYMQLTLLTPFVIYFLYKFPIVFIPIHAAVICGGSLIGQAFQIGFEETGISPAFDESYWSIVYTKPWFHYNIQIGLGVIFGILFNNYIEKRQRIDEGEKQENNMGYTVLKFVKKKFIVRFIINTLGFTLYLAMAIIGWLYIKNNKDWPLAGQLAYGLFRSLLSVIGFGLLLIPLMLSKSFILRFFFKMKGFFIMSQLSFGVFLWFPLITVAIYYHQHQMVFFNYINMLYYSIGSLIISFLVAYGGFVFMQGPILALSTIYEEAKEIREGNQKFKFKFIKITKSLF